MSINSAKLQELRNTPFENREIHYIGDLGLLRRKRVAIVGSRKPNNYAKTYTHKIAKELACAGIVVVSGGAIGVDAIAHKAAGSASTVMVAATGLDKRYPSINKNLIAEIERSGLVVSQFSQGTPSQKYNFPIRNELVVSLSEALVVTYADSNSGTMHSVRYALQQQKPIYVLPHRLGESEATTKLLRDDFATPIYDIEEFVALFGDMQTKAGTNDPFLEFCAQHPTYEEAVAKFASEVFEYELSGKIEIKNGRVFRV